MYIKVVEKKSLENGGVEQGLVKNGGMGKHLGAKGHQFGISPPPLWELLTASLSVELCVEYFFF